jgi:arylsulfatase A-like enzyme
MVSCRWNDRPNEFGVRGEVASDLGKGLGQGTHATFSPHDMNNTLLASGPDFRQGWIDQTPSGNIDLAPTVLWLLGLRPPVPMDGRVLLEALRGAPNEPPVRAAEWESHRDLGQSTWRQTLRLTNVGHVTYFLEGNGRRTAKKKP